MIKQKIKIEKYKIRKRSVIIYNKKYNKIKQMDNMDSFRAIIHTFGGCKMIFSPDTLDNTVLCTLSNSDEIITHWKRLKLENSERLEIVYGILMDALDDNNLYKSTKAYFTSLKMITNGIELNIDFNNEYYDCLKLFQTDSNITSNNGYIKIRLSKL